MKMVVPGLPNGMHGKPRLARLQQLKEKVIELREQGLSVRQIRDALKTSEKIVTQILFSKEIQAERLKRHNERLISLNNKSIDAIEKHIDSKDERVSGENARWCLEKTGAVSKGEVSLTVNAGTAIIPLDQNMIEAAREVMRRMRVALPAPVEEKKEDANVDSSIEGTLVKPNP